MTPGDEPEQTLTDGAAPDRAAVRALVDRLRTHLTLAIDDWEAEVTGGARPSDRAARRAEPPRPNRPAAVPPVRMEQLHRTPEPTADLDDLVDVLAPRLLERLVPALRAALLEAPGP